MKLLATLVLAFFVVLSSACSAQDEDLSKYINREHLGVTVAYFEQLTGPAMRVGFDSREYRIGECQFKAHVSNDSITAFSMATNDGCYFDMSSFLFPDEEYAFFRDASFGDVDGALGGISHYHADCLMSCGNAIDPSVYLHWYGPRVLDWIEVVVSAEIVTEEISAAASKVTDYLIEKHGEDWVMYQDFNCSPEDYYSVAQRAFNDVKVSEVKVGYYVYNPGCDY
ncbi:hypothetical protein [Ectothiorhodospira haloalkaliphila]|uniref:hypothetical protein n=1 Tax=Ectothiorhodospira haloalkaliphila TaxID=421628 RepID=UPI0012EB443C|nr:hypothetical protein [Ectothiorhodospira haloalkaliphila]